MIERSIESGGAMIPKERKFRASQGDIVVRLGNAGDGYPEVVATVNGARFFAYRPARENAINDVTAVYEHTCSLAEQSRLDPGESHRPKQPEEASHRMRVAIAATVAAIMAILGTMEAGKESTGTEQASVIVGQQ